MTITNARQFSAELLKEHRITARMSRMDVAKAIGFMVGPETIKRYELGMTIPGFDVALRIAKVIGVKPGDLTR